jgi:putative MATE family efflux protein
MSLSSKPVQHSDSAANSIRKDWTQGSIFKNLIGLSWPMAITQTMMTLGPTIDMIWVSRLGDVAIAGVGVSGVVVMLAQSLLMGLTMGMRALISRAIGAKDLHTAQRVAQHAVIIAAVYAVLMALIGHFFGERIVSLVTKDPQIISAGTLYLRIEFFGGATISFRMMMDAIMQASGDSMNPMRITFIYRAFHIALCPFLIFGWWFFPELGVRGAAYTSIIAQSLGVLLGIRVLFGSGSRLKLNFKDFHLDWGILWRMVSIGIPACVAGVQRNLNHFLLQVFIAPFGAAALAAHLIVQRLEMFISVPAMAFGMGAGILVGQNLGAKQPERAEKSAWLAVGLVEVFSVTVALALFFGSSPVLRLFGQDPSMDIIAVQFIRIAAVSWAFMGFMFVLMNCVQGAGDTLPMMIISIVTTWLVTVPLAYYLPKYTDWGVASIRWAITASGLTGAAINLVYFRTGRWKKHKV